MALSAGIITMLAMVTVRDGIRDLTLKGYGYDVWNRAVATNWTVTGLFFVTLVAGLACVGWLITVLKRAKPAAEKAMP
jgi:hypothetical protein